MYFSYTLRFNQSSRLVLKRNTCFHREANVQANGVNHRENGKKMRTALILLSAAAAFLIGFIISHWQ
jgi:hypothetical protein